MSSFAVEYFGVPPPERVERELRYVYTATASQTSFSANYTIGFVDVFKNGLKLNPLTDFTASNTTTVVLTTGATAGDVIQIICRRQVPQVNAYTTTEADALFRTIADSYSKTVLYTKTESDTRYLFPTGGIVLWSGSVASIPSGWALCDGTNGTPNLTNRFVLGAGGTYAVAATGGNENITLSTGNLPSHNHSYSGLVDTVGDHAHTGGTDVQGGHYHNLYFQESPGQASNIGTIPGATQDPGTGHLQGTDTQGYHSHIVNTSWNGSHNHSYSGTTASVGSGTSIDIRPKYYALAYIMKLAP